jgi:methylmalonyl-CoA mutase N-terminal domain/subunit
VIGEEEVTRQVHGLRQLRASRDQAEVDRALAEVEAVARGTANLLPPMKVALRARATLGEVSDVLRGVFGEYQPH